MIPSSSGAKPRSLRCPKLYCRPLSHKVPGVSRKPFSGPPRAPQQPAAFALTHAYTCVISVSIITPTVTDTATIELESPQNDFRNFLANKGLRVTSQRLAIFRAAFESDEHFTAEDLLGTAREIDDSVSRATVYRSLPILIESGLIREVDVGHENKYYMANRMARTFQAQVVCMDCTKIFEVDAPFMEWYGKTVCAKLNMVPETQRLQVSAHCELRETASGCPRATAK